MKLKKASCYFIFSALLVTGLAGCSSGKGQTSQTTEGSQSSVAETAEVPKAETEAAGETGLSGTLKLALWDYDTVGYDKDIVEAFEKKYPDVHVEVLSSANSEYEQKLAVMLAGGDDIDVFIAKQNLALTSLADNGYVYALNDLIEGDSLDLSNYGDLIDLHYNIDGKIYGLPYRKNDYVLFYNKNLFDQANLAYPTNDYTWEQLEQDALALSNPSNEIYGMQMIPKMIYYIKCWCGVENKFDVIEDDLTTLKKGMEYSLKMQDTDHSIEDYATTKSMNSDQNYFMKGQTGMLYNGSWFIQMLIEGKKEGKFDFDWGVVKAPYWSGTEQATYASSTPVCINAKTKNVDLAWEFLKFYTGEEGAKIMAENYMIPGYMNDEVLKSYLAADGMPADVADAVTGTATFDIVRTPNLLTNEIQNMIGEEAELVITHNQTVDEAITNMQKRREEILNK